MTTHPSSEEPARADEHASEFDDYADGYTGGGELAIKRVLGPDLSSYVEVKAEWLLRDLARLGLPLDRTRLLDYGCGTGVLLMLLRKLGFTGELAGADVSSGMLEEAKRTWPDDSPPSFARIVNGKAPHDDDAFDVVVASAVFHHVEPPERPAVYADIARMLVPGGHGYNFEHNPLNPVTQIIVRNTPIDENAILLGAGEARAGFRGAGLGELRTRYLMFFPPILRFLRPVERAIGWFPMGGQYVVSAKKPD